MDTENDAGNKTQRRTSATTSQSNTMHAAACTSPLHLSKRTRASRSSGTQGDSSRSCTKRASEASYSNGGTSTQSAGLTDDMLLGVPVSYDWMLSLIGRSAVGVPRPSATVSKCDDEAKCTTRRRQRSTRQTPAARRSASRHTSMRLAYNSS
jgi:hypothetical protein